MDTVDRTASGSFGSFGVALMGVATLTAPPLRRVDAGARTLAPRQRTRRQFTRPAQRPALVVAPAVEPAQPIVIPAKKRSTGDDRIATLDAVRLVASAGVIWVHSVPVDSQAGVYGTFGTPFFVMVAVFFLLRSLHKDPAKSFTTYAWARLGRLYVPFLAWSAIYLVARNFQRLMTGNPHLMRPEPIDFLTGTSMQLWFLPFVLLVGFAAFPIGKLLARRPQGGLGLAAACGIAAVGFALMHKPNFNAWGENWHFVERAWEHVPAVGLGVAFYVVLSRLRPSVTTTPALAFGGLALTILCVASFAVFGYSTLAKNIAGLGLMLFVLCPVRWAWVKRVGAAGVYSMGVYLMHPLVTVPVREALGRRLPHDGRLLALSAGVMLLAYGVSLAAAAALHRSRRTRWLVA